MDASTPDFFHQNTLHKPAPENFLFPAAKSQTSWKFLPHQTLGLACLTYMAVRFYNAPFTLAVPVQPLPLRIAQLCNVSLERIGKKSASPIAAHGINPFLPLCRAKNSI